MSATVGPAVASEPDPDGHGDGAGPETAGDGSFPLAAGAGSLALAAGELVLAAGAGSLAGVAGALLLLAGAGSLAGAVAELSLVAGDVPPAGVTGELTSAAAEAHELRADLLSTPNVPPGDSDHDPEDRRKCDRDGQRDRETPHPTVPSAPPGPMPAEHSIHLRVEKSLRRSPVHHRRTCAAGKLGES